MSIFLSGTVTAIILWAWVAPKEAGRWAALAHEAYNKTKENTPKG